MQRRVWTFVIPFLALVLMSTAASAYPAGVGQEEPPRPALTLRLTWLLEQLLPLAWFEKMGPEMDPGGAPAPPPAAGRTAVQGSGGELGAEMDPSGRI